MRRARARTRVLMAAMRQHATVRAHAGPRRGRPAYLVTSGAARLESLGVVPAAVDLPLLVKVDEVHQELAAHAAHEARRVPAQGVTGARCKHRQVAAA